jgi:hypothetical protein
MTLAAGILFGQEQSKPSKPLPNDVGPGRVAWFDITTTNLTQAKDFYGKLFDWKFNPLQGTDLAVEIVAGETAIGTIRVADGLRSGDRRPGKLQEGKGTWSDYRSGVPLQPARWSRRHWLVCRSVWPPDGHVLKDVDRGGE